MYSYITRSAAIGAPTAPASSPAAAASCAAAGPASASAGPRTRRARARPSARATAPRGASPRWRCAPTLQSGHRSLEVVRREPVRRGVLHERNAPGGRRAVERAEDVRDRERVRDDQGEPLRAAEDDPEAARVPLDDVP